MNLLKLKRNDYHVELSKKLKKKWPQICSKAYWLILKSDVCICNKILLFLLLLVNNCVKIIVSNFKDKANHFNENFNTQCNLTTNNSSLPSSLIYEINLGLSSISSPN